MRLIEIEKVKVPPKRQRTFRSQQDHQDLLTSISEGEAGLIHAPVLWEEEGELYLLVGQGRLDVIKEMTELGMPLRYEGETVPPGMVPYTLYPKGLSQIGKYEAEFDENVRRTPLSVAERASATAHLFELKRMKAEAAGAPPPTVGDLSMELQGTKVGGFHDNIRKELIVAKHLDDAEVRNSTSVSAAYNVVKKKEAQRQAQRIAAEMGTSVRSHYVELVQADAGEWLQTCDAGRFDIILADPPYGMGADTFGSYDEAKDHSYDDSHESWTALMASVMPLLARVAKPDAHAYLFCDFDRFHELKRYMELVGWNVHRTPLIWKNPVGFRVPWPDSGPQRKWEMILYAKRGEKKTLKVMPDVLEYVREKDTVHQAQKPLGLLRDLLGRSAFASDTVLDFCSGSGSTGIACHQLKLACVCVEKDAGAYGAAVQRLQSLALADHNFDRLRQPTIGA